MSTDNRTSLPEEYSDWTLEELLDERQQILARPFPQGCSGNERQMIDWVEEHCTNHFGAMLAALKRLAAVTDSEYPANHPCHPDVDGTNRPIKELRNAK